MNESSSEPESVFAAVGEAGLRHLVAAFYRRVPGDDLLGPMYPPADLAKAERRLADFLIYRFGGPETYIHERGQPKLRIRHAPFAIDAVARNRWVSLMDAALDEVAWPTAVVMVVKPFLYESATFLVNRD